MQQYVAVFQIRKIGVFFMCVSIVFFSDIESEYDMTGFGSGHIGIEGLDPNNEVEGQSGFWRFNRFMEFLICICKRAEEL